MIALMNHWFGPFVDIPPDHGYFYLCPRCYRERIKPHMDEVQNKLYELHPLAHRLGLEAQPGPDDGARERLRAPDSEPDPTPGGEPGGEPDPTADPSPDRSADQARVAAGGGDSEAEGQSSGPDPRAP